MKEQRYPLCRFSQSSLYLLSGFLCSIACWLQSSWNSSSLFLIPPHLTTQTVEILHFQTPFQMLPSPWDLSWFSQLSSYHFVFASVGQPAFFLCIYSFLDIVKLSALDANNGVLENRKFYITVKTIQQVKSNKCLLGAF